MNTISIAEQKPIDLEDDALDDVLADAAEELRATQMFSLAAGVEKARRLLGDVARAPESAVRLANTELANEGFVNQLDLNGVR